MVNEVRCAGHGFAHRALVVKGQRVRYRESTRMTYLAQCPDCKPGTPDCKVGIGRDEAEAIAEYARLWGTTADEITLREWHV